MSEFKPVKCHACNQLHGWSQLPTDYLKTNSSKAIDKAVGKTVSFFHLLQILTPKEFDAMRLRYGFNGSQMSVSDIADEWEKTPERIRQLLRNGIIKIESFLNEA